MKNNETCSKLRKEANFAAAKNYDDRERYMTGRDEHRFIL